MNKPALLTGDYSINLSHTAIGSRPSKAEPGVVTHKALKIDPMPNEHVVSAVLFKLAHDLSEGISKRSNSPFTRFLE